MAERPIDILLTGGTGQVGLELQSRQWPDHVRLHAPGRAELDLGDEASVRAIFGRTPYAAVINCAAYTAVDRAEDEVARAFSVNALGPALLADEARRAGIPLIHVSTDYVFDGRASAPYEEEGPTGPLNVYGASKLAGELAVRTGTPRHVILRTSWVISAHRTNFLKTMLTLAETRPVLRIVDDQVGAPTAATDIADALATISLRLVSNTGAPTGTFHFAGAGETNWAALAAEIFRLSRILGGVSASVEPIPSSAYPTAARRPRNSRLRTDKITRDYGITARPWRDAVAELVRKLSSEAVR
jgi:dTDP-4-dehydrorhamnose reductase